MPTTPPTTPPTASTAPHPTIDTPVGELIAHHPQWTKVFERLGIDYCCDGAKSLAELCGGKAVDADTVLSVLLAADEAAPTETSGDQRSWATASLSDLADHIEQTHHAYLKEELPRLQEIVKKVNQVHGDRHPYLAELETIYVSLAGDMARHMMKEELMLFPMIRRLDRGDEMPPAHAEANVQGPIEMMEHDHAAQGANLKRMRDLCDDYTPPADACHTFLGMLDALKALEADTHRHVHKENSILFPRTLDLLSQR